MAEIGGSLANEKIGRGNRQRLRSGFPENRPVWEGAFGQKGGMSVPVLDHAAKGHVLACHHRVAIALIGLVKGGDIKKPRFVFQVRTNSRFLHRLNGLLGRTVESYS